MHFWTFWAEYWPFLPVWSHAWPKNNAKKVPRWVFRYVGNKTFDFSSKNLEFLPKNDQIWPEIGIFARPCRLIWCPVGGLVGGCSARAVSRKTPIYFIIGLLRSTSMYGIYSRILNNRLNTEVELQPSLNAHVAKRIFTTNKVSVVQEQKKSINGITILVIFSFVWFGRGQEITSWQTHVRNMTAPHINFVISI